MDGGEILNIFACFITEWEKEGEDTSGDDDNDNNDDESEGGGDAEDKNTTKKGKAKQATAKTFRSRVLQEMEGSEEAIVL